MFDMTSIDVAIGMILIYATYSILASFVLEIISMVLRLRARTLSYTIWRIFTDDSSIYKEDRKDPESLWYKFFNHPRIKYLVKKRKFAVLNKIWPDFPSYIEPETFSEVVLDLVKFDPYKNSSICNTIKEREFLKYLKSIYHTYDKDVIKIKTQIEKWYDDTTERAMGWYKRQTSWILFAIGLLIAGIFNVNTIDSIDVLYHDSNVRNTILPALPEITKYEKLAINNTSLNDSLSKNLDSIMIDISNVYKIQKSFGRGWSEDECTKFKKNWFFHSLGFLLTALAISFGAPLWFDILNKAISLRSSLKIPKKDNTEK